MMKYKTRVVSVDWGSTFTSMDASAVQRDCDLVLNEEAAEGWKMVSAYPLVSGNSHRTRKVVFHFEKEESSQ